MQPQQLTLKIQPSDKATFSNFYQGDNLQLLNALKQLANNSGEQFIYIWGVQGSGCSHLLQACCHAAAKNQQAVMLISLADPELNPDILQSIENLSLICLDDIAAVLGKPDWEEALLYFYNRAREKGVRLVIAGTKPPNQLVCQLADFQSRLSWGLIFRVVALTDEQKLLALQMRAENLGLTLPRVVTQFLLHHYSRESTQLFTALATLDQFCWTTKRRLTIPFVKEILQLNNPSKQD